MLNPEVWNWKKMDYAMCGVMYVLVKRYETESVLVSSYLNYTVKDVDLVRATNVLEGPAESSFTV